MLRFDSRLPSPGFTSTSVYFTWPEASPPSVFKAESGGGNEHLARGTTSFRRKKRVKGKNPICSFKKEKKLSEKDLKGEDQVSTERYIDVYEAWIFISRRQLHLARQTDTQAKRVILLETEKMNCLNTPITHTFHQTMTKV